ncbi:MAG: alpha/beta hydrolase, partial [Pseudomonadota bacterium]
DERYYSNELGGLSAGRCAVGIESGSDGDGSLIGTESSTVLETVASLEPYRDSGIVVYFHGYYEDFERSCRRAATFKRRLASGDGFLLFSWPANSTPLTYGADVADLEASTPVFLEFLNELGRRHGPENISIIGHSLGTRGLVKALSDWPDSEGRFRNLVLIAADIDRERFVEAVPILKERIDEITVLVSDRDLALRVSETVNDAPRLGQSDGVVIDGVTFFDVTDIANQHLTGHIYHLRNDRVVDIIRRVLSGDVDTG